MKFDLDLPRSDRGSDAVLPGFPAASRRAWTFSDPVFTGCVQIADAIAVLAAFCAAYLVYLYHSPFAPLENYAAAVAVIVLQIGRAHV